MKIILADHIYTNGIYLKNLAIAFDKTIIAIDKPIKLKKRYPDATIIKAKPNSIIYPGFINTHVHLEFSSNKTTLEYGDFMIWLDSVIRERDGLLELCNSDTMEEQCTQMLESGITRFGAVSSYGFDLDACINAKQKVTFYNELIGSNPQTADILYSDFLERVESSIQTQKEDNITPAVAIHSPYSVHPIVAKRAIALAKENSYPLSAHLLESHHEKRWLESNSGDFLGFFQKFFNTSSSVNTVDSFLKLFDEYPTHFIHCTETSREEKEYLYKKNHSICHCPRSNRLLGTKRLEIEDINTTMSIATDGLSSNWSLNIWDELRAALMLHHRGDMEMMSDRFIKSATSDAAKAINCSEGSIAEGRPADLTIITLPSKCINSNQLSLQAILHTQKADIVYIDGNMVYSADNN